eukprot:6205249-Pleurochrysis_carterae.AAC.1
MHAHAHAQLSSSPAKRALTQSHSRSARRTPSLASLHLALPLSASVHLPGSRSVVPRCCCGHCPYSSRRSTRCSPTCAG